MLPKATEDNAGLADFFLTHHAKNNDEPKKTSVRISPKSPETTPMARQYPRIEECNHLRRLPRHWRYHLRHRHNNQRIVTGSRQQSKAERPRQIPFT